MNCFTHSGTAAVGMCVLCQKGICHECVARETPRLVCRACDARGSMPGYGWYGRYGYGYEYRASTLSPCARGSPGVS
jgi:ribosomal protein L40E